MAAKAFNNVIIGQFVLSGVPVKVYVGNRFLTVTDTDDVEDALIGFGMDEDGQMIQFSYPEVQFLQVQGNKIDIATYNQGMEKLHSGDSAPAQKDEEPPAEEEAEEAPESDNLGPKESVSMKLTDLLTEADVESIKKDIMDLKKELIDKKKELMDAQAEEMEDEIEDTEDSMEESKLNEYTFGTGDIVNDKDPGCPHYGSKGIVIQIPKQGLIRYTVTNVGDTFKPGDILTKSEKQLEKI